jgi:hypothetical protein
MNWADERMGETEGIAGVENEASNEVDYCCPLIPPGLALDILMKPLRR